MRELAIEGIDGSGKSSVTSELLINLKSEGYSVRAISPFREIQRHVTAKGINIWNSEYDIEKALPALENLLFDCHKEAIANNIDFVIYDRHLLSAAVFTAEFPTQNLLVKSMLDGLIETVFLSVKPETAYCRELDKQEDSSEHVNFEQLVKDKSNFNSLVNEHLDRILGIYRSDTDVTPEMIVRNIMWDLNIRR